MSIETVDIPSSPGAQSRTGAVPKTARSPRQSSTLFRVIWRWHFFAGVIVSPFLVVVALTGGLYTFAAEISDFANRDILFVASSGSAPRPYQTLQDTAEAAVPGGRAKNIQTFADPERTAIVSVIPAKNDEASKSDQSRGGGRGRGISVYVNPYTAEVQGTSDGPRKLDGFFRGVLDLHRRLFVGTTGRIIVELTTTWSIILIVSGVYLWWPRRRDKWKGVWVPRWTAKPYTILRDLHSLMGIYLLPICVVIAVTGLFYTIVWGESFHAVTKPLFGEAAASEEQSNERGERRGDRDREEDRAELVPPPTFSLQEAMEKSRSLYPDRDITITLPRGADEHYDVGSINDYARATYGAMDSTGFKLHRDTGAVLDVSDLSDDERYWWHTWAYPLHVGSVVGLASKLFWLAACLVLAALPVTGLWMWWKRRPRGRTGVPRKLPFDNVSAWVWIAIVLMCVLLPIFGISVVAIVVGDRILHQVRSAFAASRPEP